MCENTRKCTPQRAGYAKIESRVTVKSKSKMQLATINMHDKAEVSWYQEFLETAMYPFMATCA